MISRIRGVLEKVDENRVEIRTGDLVYEILVPVYLEIKLRQKKNQPVELFVQHYLEGGQSGSTMIPRLVGFSNETEREFFTFLIKVPGLGAKKVLKSMIVPPSEIARAIESEDKVSLANLPGMGKRTADKIIATLKGKVATFAAGTESSASASWGEMEEEAVMVLIQLSYKQSEAQALVRRIKKHEPELDGAEAIVKAVLKEVGSKAI